MSLRKLAAPALVLVLASGCARTGDIAEGGGITAVRSACPRVGVPAALGDITLFDPPSSRDASAIDVTAVLTNVQSTCTEAGDEIVTNLTFDVHARRARGDGARDVALPYLVTMVRGGNAVVAKRVGNVALRFEPGQLRATASGQASTVVSRAAATLPAEVRERLTRRRKAGEQEAAMDPLSDPAVRQAVLAASFEALVGFQLTEEQLRYNATR